MRGALWLLLWEEGIRRVAIVLWWFFTWANVNCVWTIYLVYRLRGAIYSVLAIKTLRWFHFAALFACLDLYHLLWKPCADHPHREYTSRFHFLPFHPRYRLAHLFRGSSLVFIPFISRNYPVEIIIVNCNTFPTIFLCEHCLWDWHWIFDGGKLNTQVYEFHLPVDKFHLPVNRYYISLCGLLFYLRRDDCLFIFLSSSNPFIFALWLAMKPIKKW